MSEGDVWFIDYGEHPPCLHSRILCCHIQNSTWVIATPDGDVYEEQLDNANVDVVNVVQGNGGLGSPLPAGINPNHVYSFRPMTAAAYQDLLRQARQYAAGLRISLGLPPPGLQPAPGMGGQAPAADPLVWIAMENEDGRYIGEVVCDVGIPLPPGHVTLGGTKALIPTASGSLFVKQVLKSKINTVEVQDLRVLPLDFDEQKNRRIDFAKTVGRMRQHDMPGGGIMLDGPVSSLQVLKGMVARGLTPTTDHEHWVRTHETLRGDRSVYEMEVLTRALEAMVVVDQLNVPNLKGCELLVRRWQLIREAHRLSPGAPDYSAADVFMGWEFRRGDGVDPALARFVASELKDQAQIAKESRKAKEEINQRKKGGGRGGASSAGGQDS